MNPADYHIKDKDGSRLYAIPTHQLPDGFHPQPADIANDTWIVPSVNTIIQTATNGMALYKATLAAVEQYEQLGQQIERDPKRARRWLTKQEPESLTAKADHGIAVHEAVEQLTKGDTLVGIPEQQRGPVEAMIRFTMHHRVKYLHSETVVFNIQRRYAGTVDAIARIGDLMWMLDWKTGYLPAHKPYPSQQMQLAAYAACTHMLIGGKAVPLPDIDHAAAVRLHDESYDFVRVPSLTRAMVGFDACNTLYRLGL